MAAWLAWQETLNPRGIELGLQRCLPVARALGLLPFPAPVISVAGTNGKGSCVALLESMLGAGGYRVGAYTSPHLIRYNETVRVAGQAASDAALMEAFEAVADARGEVPLTWFEFRTLAAARILRDARLDVAVLEVGLGGRLDAVNMFDADVAVVTSIGVDHVDWLGPDRDGIGREKAGIGRRGRPLVCADPDPPRGLLEAAREQGARLVAVGRDYRVEAHGDSFSYTRADGGCADLPRPGIPGRCQLQNAGAALAALDCLGRRLALDAGAVRRGIAGCRLAGRQQILGRAPLILADVAHNPQAAQALEEGLAAQPCRGRTRALLAMYADKDIAGVAAAVSPRIDDWYLAGLPPPRGAPAAKTAAALEGANRAAGARLFEDVAGAFEAAKRDSADDDRIVAFGSFETARRVIELESCGS